MASSSKQQLLRLYGRFYLPVLSLAVLTGITASMALPSALHVLIPAMESAVFVSLPQLWNAFLSWVTPPCLFVLLNGIIMILTANSGIFTRSLVKMENVQKQSAALMVEASAVRQDKVSRWGNSRVSEWEVSSEVSKWEDTRVSQWGKSGVSAADGDEEEESKISEEDEEPPKKTTEINRLEIDCLESNYGQIKGGSEPSSPHFATLLEGDEEEETMISEEDKEPPRKIMEIRSLEIACLERNYGQIKAGSEPSSPHFATPLKNSIIRSLSIDSASVKESEASEDLSDEAFRKRIEDFISKVNAQLRSETN